MQKILTPVHDVYGLRIKRDDLYTPYGIGDVNGGKLRQCRELIKAVNPKAVVTACSIHSPQAPIAAAVAQEFGIPCTVFYGGTTKERMQELPMPRLALHHGAKIIIAAKTGRHNVLYSKAKEYAKDNYAFVIEYGFNITEYPEVMYGAVASQCENIPDDADRIAITCGSGITTCGVMSGCKQFEKRVKEFHLFCTAPDRSKRIEPFIPRGCEVIRHDMFHEKGFVYEREEPAQFASIQLHPNYEAKAMRRFIKDGVPKENTLFWIVGSKPTLRV